MNQAELFPVGHVVGVDVEDGIRYRLVVCEPAQATQLVEIPGYEAVGTQAERFAPGGRPAGYMTVYQFVEREATILPVRREPIVD